MYCASTVFEFLNIEDLEVDYVIAILMNERETTLISLYETFSLGGDIDIVKELRWNGIKKQDRCDLNATLNLHKIILW